MNKYRVGDHVIIKKAKLTGVVQRVLMTKEILQTVHQPTEPVYEILTGMGLFYVKQSGLALVTKPSTNPRLKGSMSKPVRVNPRRVPWDVERKFPLTGDKKYWFGKGFDDAVNGERQRSRKYYYVKGYQTGMDYVLRRMTPRSNPGGQTVIYGRVLRIEAQKTQPHRCDAGCKRSGHRYFHDFKASSNATIIGMPAGVDSKDRSLRIVSKERK